MIPTRRETNEVSPRDTPTHCLERFTGHKHMEGSKDKSGGLVELRRPGVESGLEGWRLGFAWKFPGGEKTKTERARDQQRAVLVSLAEHCSVHVCKKMNQAGKEPLEAVRITPRTHEGWVSCMFSPHCTE